MVIILLSCTTIGQTPTLPSTKPVDLLISSKDLPVGWKSEEAFSDKYDDLCYRDCAMTQFFLVEEEKASSEQSIYMYNTIEEAEKTYENQLTPLQLGTTPSDWSYDSAVAFQSNFACYHHKGAAFPSCSWIAQYGKYLVFFVASVLPERMSLNDLENVVRRIDAKMKVVTTQST
jgi:hypothetical protein